MVLYMTEVEGGDYRKNLPLTMSNEGSFPNYLLAFIN